jgi:3'-phosphoadenosine 5'-phosphosulfate sulfotransferase (PAPS reductase)/FAD synthetase
MNYLDQLEQQSVYILREAFRHFERLCMLWSIGKDSTVLLWLARKAFFGHVPFPLVHIDTSYKLPEMITYRDRLALEYKLTMIVGQNVDAIKAGRTFPATQHLPEGHPGQSVSVGMLRPFEERRFGQYVERCLASPEVKPHHGAV